MIKKIRDKNVSFVDEEGNRRLGIRQQEKPPHSQPIWIFDLDFGLNPQSALRSKMHFAMHCLDPKVGFCLINERWTAVPCPPRDGACPWVRISSAHLDACINNPRPRSVTGTS